MSAPEPGLIIHVSPLVETFVDDERTTARFRICTLHRQIGQLNPYAEPPTIFELLGLDAHASPFTNHGVGTFPGEAGYHHTRDLINDAYWRSGEPYFGAIGGHNAGDGGGSEDSRGAAQNQLDVLSSAAAMLLDPGIRALYLREFLPELTRTGWGAKAWDRSGRNKALRALCPEHS